MNETFNNPGGATPDAVNNLARGAAAGRGRTVDNTSWGGMGFGNSNVNTAGRAIPGNQAVGGPSFSQANRQTGYSQTPQMPVDPATGGNTAGGTGGGTSNQGYSFTTGNGLTQPIPPGGMNPNPTAVQQWKAPTAAQIAQGFTTAPDGPLAPEYANMQAGVQAAIAQNSKKPANYSIATNDPNIWMSPEGGTWMTPGYSPNNGKGLNSWEVYGTNPSLNVPLYNLPGGSYWQNPNEGPNSGALTQLQNPQQVLDMLKTLPNRTTGTGSDPMALLAGALNPDSPIMTQKHLGQATNWGNNLMNPKPDEGSQTTTNNQNVGPGGTQTPVGRTSESSQINPDASTQNTTPSGNSIDDNSKRLLEAMFGNNAPSILAALMNGTRSLTNINGRGLADTGSTTPATNSNTQTQNTGNNTGIVDIGGQKTRWDPHNQYHVPI